MPTDPRDLVKLAQKDREGAEQGQSLLSRMKIAADPELHAEHQFCPQDEGFLLNGEGSPADFLSSRFPALGPALSVKVSGREDMSGTRLLNRRHQLRQSFEFFEPSLKRTDLPDIPGIRLKPLMRLTASLYYMNRLTEDPEARRALRQDGFKVSGNGDDTVVVFDEIARRLKFSDKERAFGRELLQEIPYTGNPAEVNDFLIGPPGRNLSRLDQSQAADLKARAAELGVSPSTLFSIGELFHVAQRGLAPFEMRGMNWTDEGFRGYDLGSMGFSKVAQTVTAIPPETNLLQEIAAARDEIAQLQDETRLAETPKARHPLFKQGRLSAQGMVLAHAASGIPLGGKLRPNARFQDGPPLVGNPREIVEFSWNGVIDQWNDAPVAILIPLSKVPAKKLSNLWYTATSTLGEFEIPEGSRLLVREDLEIPPAELKLWREKGIEVSRHGVDEPTAEVAESVIGKMGYEAMELGTDLWGGLGADTTWLDKATMTDHFRPENEALTTRASAELARGLGVSHSAGTEDYPLGDLTYSMESLFKDFNKEGLLLPSWGKLEKHTDQIERFRNSLEKASQTESGPAWDRAKAHAERYLEGMEVELAFWNRTGAAGARALERELRAGSPGPATELFVAEFCARHNLEVDYRTISSVEALKSLRRSV